MTAGLELFIKTLQESRGLTEFEVSYLKALIQQSEREAVEKALYERVKNLGN